MADVVSPRGVTYNVTCHQWFTNGLSSILTLPTICVHMCSVSQVSFHASNGRDGQLSIYCSSFGLSLCSIATYPVRDYSGLMVTHFQTIFHLYDRRGTDVFTP